jgi:putative Ca2+/H+ antiporter (TMEM165/GDT1 family)
MEWITWITTYTLIILAELGDKTQIATLVLASNNPRRKWLVFAAGALALTMCVLIEVTVGTTLARYVTQDTINRVTAVIFFVFGVVTLFKQYALAKGWNLRYGILPVISGEKTSVESQKA